MGTVHDIEQAKIKADNAERRRQHEAQQKSIDDRAKAESEAQAQQHKDNLAQNMLRSQQGIRSQCVSNAQGRLVDQSRTDQTAPPTVEEIIKEAVVLETFILSGQKPAAT